jgi:hypothetical protein
MRCEDLGFWRNCRGRKHRQCKRSQYQEVFIEILVLLRI